MTPGVEISLGEVAAALALVVLALAISLWWRTGLVSDYAVAVIRSFVQLTAIGYVIQAIFDEDTLALVLVLIAVMVVFGAYTARRRAARVPAAFVPLLIALTLAATATLGLVVGLDIFPAEPRYLVPVSGMVIGNAMIAAAVALDRLGDDMRESAPRLEATLALGATASQAAAPIVRRSLRSGMIPMVEATKTTGLIFFPGTMVGMLLAGAEPVDAVRLQLVLLWTMFGAIAVATLVATALAYRGFFTAAHQLREPPVP